eukprot:m.44573 g.44573  ORF g.44573 m.44573 type:complete len:164 (-) comp15097_c0_seq4:4461-4952(-)
MPSKKKAPKVDNADLTALDKEHNKKEERRRKEDERRRQEDEEERVLLRRSVLEERAKNKSLQEENEYLQQDIESSKKELDEAIANQKLLKSNYDELKEHADKIESEKMELQRKDTCVSARIHQESEQERIPLLHVVCACAETVRVHGDLNIALLTAHFDMGTR